MPLKVVPQLEDFARIEAWYGKLPDHASEEERVERYRLMQIAKLIRLQQHGLLPADTMREMDQILGPSLKPSGQGRFGDG